MCGIAGVAGRNLDPDSTTKTVSRMMRLLHHRGPDGDGAASGPGFSFGHKRLAIIDIAGGRQPMTTPDGRYTLVFNGEIYNYVELRQELTRRGEHFSTFSDTEVLLRLFAREGLGCLNKLNGMFAFAVFDSREQVLYAARDHFGVKPFYYRITPSGACVFASEIKALFAHEEIRPETDPSSLDEYLTFQFTLNARTLFKGISRLEPGTAFEWRPGDAAPRITAYWNLSFEIDVSHTESYFRDTLLGLLQDSVRLQLRSDVPVGAYLSGGLDSSIVSTLAAASYGAGFSVFCGRFLESPAYDESRYARIVADTIGAQYYDIVPTANDFVENLPKLIYHLDEPVAGPGLFPQYIVSREASRHLKVVLGGQGGDEVFGGYTRYLVGYLEQALKGAIFETQEEGRHIVTLASIIPNLPQLKNYLPLMQTFWKDGLFGPMEDRYLRLVDRSHDLQNLMSAEYWQARDQASILENFRSLFAQPDTPSYFNRMTHFDMKTLLPALLQVEDRVSMAVSLESRVPLLDRRIVELVASVPPAMKFGGGQTKYLLRHAVSNLVPEAVMKRQDKMGFPVPLKEWSQAGPVRDFLCDTLLSTRCRERGLYRPEAIGALIDNEGRFGRQLWGILSLELWHQVFFDGMHVPRA
jgi:asparagine synthase (glutamine-hydrolysing)